MLQVPGKPQVKDIPLYLSVTSYSKVSPFPSIGVSTKQINLWTLRRYSLLPLRPPPFLHSFLPSFAIACLPGFIAGKRRRDSGGGDDSERPREKVAPRFFVLPSLFLGEIPLYFNCITFLIRYDAAVRWSSAIPTDCFCFSTLTVYFGHDIINWC